MRSLLDKEVACYLSHILSPAICLSLKFTSDYLHDESRQGRRLKGPSAGAELVENTAQRPDVRPEDQGRHDGQSEVKIAHLHHLLGVVRSSLAELRGDVAWRAHHCQGLALAREDLGDAEVADLDMVEGAGEEDVL